MFILIFIGDPSCPEEVRRAKRIARLIDDQNACVALNQGFDSSEPSGEVNAGDEEENDNELASENLPVSGPERRRECEFCDSLYELVPKFF